MAAQQNTTYTGTEGPANDLDSSGQSCFSIASFASLQSASTSFVILKFNVSFL